MLNAANCKPEKTVEPAHPLRITPGEIVVDRDQMRAATGERVQIKGQRRHKCLAFSRRHFGDPAAVQDDAAEQLHVEVHHVPNHRLIANHETVLAVV